MASDGDAMAAAASDGAHGGAATAEASEGAQPNQSVGRVPEHCLICGAVRKYDAKWTRASIAMQQRLPPRYRRNRYHDPAK